MDEYYGYRTISMKDNELSDFYANLYDVSFLKINEYGLIENNGEIIDTICYQGDTLRHVRWPIIKGRREDLHPRNIYQSLAIDLLLDTKSKVKLLRGVYGSGKDLLMTTAALSFNLYRPAENPALTPESAISPGWKISTISASKTTSPSTITRPAQSL